MGILDNLLNKAANAAQSGVRKAAGAAANGISNAAAGGLAAAANGVKTAGSANVRAAQAAGEAASGSGVTMTTGKTSQGYPSVTVTFDALPSSLAELQAAPLADLQTPYGTAALTVAALNQYEANRAAALEMVNFLRGPRPLSAHEEQFIRDRLAGKMYVIRSYWAGTSPQNNYTPTLPYSITFYEDPYSYQSEGYCRLNCRSSGADSPRQIMLRKKESTGEWFLWENYLLPDIRIPAEADPWA